MASSIQSPDFLRLSSNPLSPTAPFAGYREGDLLRAGFSHEDVCEVSNHDPARLRAAGLSAAEVVAGCSRGGGVGGLPAGLQGFRGVQRLRAAGYSATELVAAGLDNAWDLRQAGAWRAGRVARWEDGWVGGWVGGRVGLEVEAGSAQAWDRGW